MIDIVRALKAPARRVGEAPFPPGHYWVRASNLPPTLHSTVAYWDGFGWLIPGRARRLGSVGVYVLSERLPQPVTRLEPGKFSPETESRLIGAASVGGSELLLPWWLGGALLPWRRRANEPVREMPTASDLAAPPTRE